MPPLLQADPFTLHKPRCKKPHNMTPSMSSSTSTSMSASTSVEASITPSHSIETASVFTTRHYPTTRSSCAPSSPNSRLTVDCCSSSISLPPSVRFL
ncbi:putative transposase domain protein [Burkholderia pseudomallei]|nr:putative transposase domain protein [Burkholderia pseudomallei]